MKIVSAGMAVTALLAAGVAHAAQCVDAKEAKNGFVLSRPGIRSEFRPAAGGVVAVSNTYGSQSPQEAVPVCGGWSRSFETATLDELATIPLSDCAKTVSAEARSQENNRFRRVVAQQAGKRAQDVDPGGEGQGNVQRWFLQLCRSGGQRDVQERGRRNT